MTTKDKFDVVYGFILAAVACYLIITIFWRIDDLKYRINILEQQCPCQINYGGQNMSVEDAFERSGEGLTIDQADEVQILIEEYCNGSR